MSILIDQKTRVLVQGIKGQRSKMSLKASLDYGTNIVAGAAFGLGGQRMYNLPMYNTVRGAAKKHELDATVIYTKGPTVKQEVMEACQAGIKLIFILEEKVSIHDRAEMLEIARKFGSKIIGPNSNGIISVGKSKIGTIGGTNPDRTFLKGKIGLISRSVGMASEIAYLFKKNNLGISTCVTMGSDDIVGFRMKDLVQLFMKDNETDLIFIFGTDGSLEEDDTAEKILREQYKKPIFAYLSGYFLNSENREKFFGCQTCQLNRTFSSVIEKRDKLKHAGVRVIDRFEDIPSIVNNSLLSLHTINNSIHDIKKV